MKVLTLAIGEKIYTSTKITAWQAREAFSVSKDMLTLAKTGEAVSNSEQGDTEQMGMFFEKINEVADKKANLICEVYGNKFTVDELEKCLSSAEIDSQIWKIIDGINGVVEKN